MSRNHDLEPESAETPLSETEQRNQARIQLGNKLSSSRKSKAMSLSEVCDRLRIQCAYLQGLENGDWSKLPEEVYVMGFLRQYAALLGVDINAETEALKPSEYRLTKPFTMPDPPIAMNRGWAIAASVAFLLLLVLFNVVDEEQEEITTSQSIQDSTIAPTDLMENAEHPVAVKNASTTMNNPPAAEKIPAAPQIKSAISVPAEPELSSAKTIQTKKDASKTDELKTDQPYVAPEKRKSADAPFAGHRFRLKAVNQDVWLQLHTPDGELLKEALLRSGETLSINFPQAHLMLTSGNPLALRISIDGQLLVEVGTLGEKDKVLRNYSLQIPIESTDQTAQ